MFENKAKRTPLTEKQIRERKLPPKVLTPVQCELEDNGDLFIEVSDFADYQISEWMYITVTTYRRSSIIILSDGAVLPEIGNIWRINFAKIHRQNKNESDREHAERLGRDLRNSFHQTALLMKEFLGKGGSINAVLGYSHLLNRPAASTLFGFDIIQVELDKHISTESAVRYISKAKSREAKKDFRRRKKFTPPVFGIISSKKFIEMYSKLED